MNFEESAKKLYTLPWQALYDLAVEKQIDGEEIKHKEKTEIIRRVLLSDITEAEIEAVIDDYTYGNRVTFTLWGFSKTLSVEDISALKALEQTEEDYIDVEGFRNLKYVSQSTQFCPPSHQSWWSGGLCCSHTIILHLCLRSGQISTRPCNGPHKRKRQTSPRIKRPPSQGELLFSEMAVFYL